MRDDRGFTLIELIIVIALIGIVSAIAIPNLTDMMPGMRVNAAARQIMSEMLLLKMRAVSENRAYRMSFTPGGNRFTIKQDTNRDGSWDAGDTESASTIPAGIIFGTNAARRTDNSTAMCNDAVCFDTGTDNATIFRGNGSTELGSVYLIPQIDTTTGRNDRMRGITVDGAGRVKTWRFQGGRWTAF